MLVTVLPVLFGVYLRKSMRITPRASLNTVADGTVFAFFVALSPSSNHCLECYFQWIRISSKLVKWIKSSVELPLKRSKRCWEVLRVHFRTTVETRLPLHRLLLDFINTKMFVKSCGYDYQSFCIISKLAYLQSAMVKIRFMSNITPFFHNDKRILY